MEKNIYENGGCKIILATEENAYETEVFEYDNKSEAVEWLKWELTNPDSEYQIEDWEDEPDVEECCHYTNVEGYHIIALIVESEGEEKEELKNINDEWRKPMLAECGEDED